MAVHFERGTAHVDWCEPNYAVSPDIAEFFNTVRGMLKFSVYGQNMNNDIVSLWFNMAILYVIILNGNINI